eukprot:scaffold168744_cov37-Tisochrysis_lutea.AAC.2
MQQLSACGEKPQPQAGLQATACRGQSSAKHELSEVGFLDAHSLVNGASKGGFTDKEQGKKKTPHSGQWASRDVRHAKHAHAHETETNSVTYRQQMRAQARESTSRGEEEREREYVRGARETFDL